jgi:tetratricopeptide (TPR) repeat protein
VPRPRLYISRDTAYDWLTALEFGVTDDGQPSGCWHPVSDDIAYLHDAPDGAGRCLGFALKRFSYFDPHDEELAALWTGPRFDVPVLGLHNATAGEIAVATESFLQGESTLNRHLFHQAIDAAGDSDTALERWRYCLETGDVMAHYSLGYTFFDAGYFREAYRHLRAYTEIAPTNAWGWCWFGKAAAALGQNHEAIAAFNRALQLEDDSNHETEAADLLDELTRRIGG